MDLDFAITILVCQASEHLESFYVCSPSKGIADRIISPSVYMGLGDLNSGLHASTAVPPLHITF